MDVRVCNKTLVLEKWRFNLLQVGSCLLITTVEASQKDVFLCAVICSNLSCTMTWITVAIAQVAVSASFVPANPVIEGLVQCWYHFAVVESLWSRCIQFPFVTCLLAWCLRTNTVAPEGVVLTLILRVKHQLKVIQRFGRAMVSCINMAVVVDQAWTRIVDRAVLWCATVRIGQCSSRHGQPCGAIQ